MSSPPDAVAAIEPAVSAAGAPSRAKAAVLSLLVCAVAYNDYDDVSSPLPVTAAEFDDMVGFGPRDVQRRRLEACRELLGALRSFQSDAKRTRDAAVLVGGGSGGGENLDDDDDDDDDDEEEEGTFIRTNMVDYNKQSKGIRRSSSGCRDPSRGRRSSCEKHHDGAAARAGVRSLLRSLPASALSRLPSTLSSLLSERVDNFSLLPATLDETANEEIMASASTGKRAMTISKLGMTAGRAYAELIGITGAWGAGLIDVGALSGLAALVRRWCVECRGREVAEVPTEGEEEDEEGTPLAGKKQGCRGKKKNASGATALIAGKKRKGRTGARGEKERNVAPRCRQQQETRRSGRNRKVVQFAEEDDLEDFSDEGFGSQDSPDSESSLVVMKGNSEDPMVQSESEMILGGLHLAESLARAPALPDFAGWSSEAREALLDAAVVAMATAAALADKGPNKNSEVGPLCRSVVKALSASLISCVLRGECGADEDGDEEEHFYSLVTSSQRSRSRGRRKETTNVKENLSINIPECDRGEGLGMGRTSVGSNSRCHENAIFILRGLLPLLTSSVELPNGLRGKTSAYGAALSVLEGIVRLASVEIGEHVGSMYVLARRSLSSRTTLSHRNAPATTPNSSQQGRARGWGEASGKTPFILTPKTDNKRSRRRLSDTVDRRKSGATPCPPSLKKAVTPSRTRTHTPNRAREGSHPEDALKPPRPVLGATLGLLHKLSTIKGLERAAARQRSAEVAKRCIPLFPILERTHALRFVARLCQSRAASHRLFGVELIGELLPEKWLWEDHYEEARRRRLVSDISSCDATEAVLGVSSPSPFQINIKPSIPLTLLHVLQGRISDRAPAVRARAAHALSEALSAFLPSDAADRSFVASDESMEREVETEAKGYFREAVVLASPQLIVSLRRRAVGDERATVRKASVDALLAVLLAANMALVPSEGINNDGDVSRSAVGVSEADVVALSRLCTDASVAVRKAASYAITTLLRREYHREQATATIELLGAAWAKDVLPLILDAESTCAARTAEFFATIVIDPILQVGGENPKWGDNSYKRNRYMVAMKVLCQVSECANEAGAARGGTRALKVAVKKIFDDAGSSYKSISGPLLRELHRVAEVTLGLGKETYHQRLALEDQNTLLHVENDDTETLRGGAWCLLDALTDCNPTDQTAVTSGGISLASAATSLRGFNLAQAVKSSSFDAAFLASAWEKLHEMSFRVGLTEKSESSIVATSRACLRVISRLGSFVPIPEARRSADNLKLLLESFDLSPDLIGTAVSALIVLTDKLGTDANDSSRDDVYALCTKWATDIFNSCEKTIESFISSPAIPLCIDRLERAVFTAGEVSMIGFATDEDPTKTQGRREPRPGDPVRGLKPRPGDRLIYLVQTLLPPTLPVIDGESCRSTPHALRAFAFITLGKFCLRDERLAKESLNLIARELHQNLNDSGASVQSNALLVMGDLCVKYTNLVDKFLPAMASCLQVSSGSKAIPSHLLIRVDESAMVRKHAILLLSSLLLQDYIKWRGLLVHRFLAACVDDDDGVSQLAETTVCGPLLSKQQNLFYNSFVEAIFVLNGCTAHRIYAAAKSSGDGGAGVAVGFDGVNLSGPDGRIRRLRIYRLMLSRMSDEEKIGVTARLAKEVLAGAVETEGDLSLACRKPPKFGQYPHNIQQRIEKARHVLSDCFAILSSPCARVGRKATSNGEDDEDLNASTASNGPTTAQLSAVKGRLLSKISRKHAIETIIPILCSLKSILEANRLPLLKDLMRLMVEIFRSNKTEVKELLATDPTLLQELEYDTKQYEKQKKQQGVDVTSFPEVSGEPDSGELPLGAIPDGAII